MRDSGLNGSKKRKADRSCKYSRSKKRRDGQYVLLNPKNQSSSNSSSQEDSTRSLSPNNDKKVQSNVLAMFHENNFEQESQESTDSEWNSITAEESSDSCFSSSLDEESSADIHAFHESDCESVESENLDANDWTTDSSNDTDYRPDIEDIIVHPGNAILHDADDLDELFSNDDTQIIELEDDSVASSSDESGASCPELVPIPVGNHQIPSMKDSTEIASAIDNYDELQNWPIFSECNAELSKYATFFNCLDRKSVVLKLSGTIYFNGVLKIKLLFNSLEVNGYTLSINEESTISSILNSDYILNLTPGFKYYQDNKLEFKSVLDQLRNKLHERDILKIQNSIDLNNDVLLSLEAGSISSSIELLQASLAMGFLPRKISLLKHSAIPTSELILSTKFFIENQQNQNLIYKKNYQWDCIELTPKSKFIVIGGKNVGKSSLVQYLINKNIKKFKKILLIDLDVGQPICSLPQTVSATIIEKAILGKGCLSDNISSPIKCLIYGDKNVVVAPFKYVQCVHKIMQFCHNNLELQNIPWIINSMGFQKGFGMQLICILLKIIRPTDVIQIQHSTKGFNFKEIITEQFITSYKFSLFNPEEFEDCSVQYFTTHVIDSIVNRDQDSKWNSNSSVKRKIILICHLSKLLKSCTHLNDVVPYCNLLSKIEVHIMDQQFSVNNELNTELLNGNLVFLCKNSSDDKLLNCYGIGLVRAIDRVNDRIYMLMPGQLVDVLDKITVLSISNMSLPSELIIKQPNCNSLIPYSLRNREAEK